MLLLIVSVLSKLQAISRYYLFIVITSLLRTVISIMAALLFLSNTSTTILIILDCVASANG